jgi:hypothetical protein
MDTFSTQMQNVRKNINMIKISLEVHYNYIIHETKIYIDDALIFARVALLVLLATLV